MVVYAYKRPEAAVSCPDWRRLLWSSGQCSVDERQRIWHSPGSVPAASSQARFCSEAVRYDLSGMHGLFRSMSNLLAEQRCCPIRDIARRFLANEASTLLSTQPTTHNTHQGNRHTTHNHGQPRSAIFVPKEITDHQTSRSRSRDITSLPLRAHTNLTTGKVAPARWVAEDRPTRAPSSRAPSTPAARTPAALAPAAAATTGAVSAAAAATTPNQAMAAISSKSPATAPVSSRATVATTSTRNPMAGSA